MSNSPHFANVELNGSSGVDHFPSKVPLRGHTDAYIALWNDAPTSSTLDETRRFDRPLAEATA